MARSRLATVTVSRGLIAAGLLAMLTAGCSATPTSSPAETSPSPLSSSTAPPSTESSPPDAAADTSISGGSSDPGTLVTTGLGIAPVGQVLEGVRVERVVDGDTFKAVVDGELVSVRIIGFDTPETVKPGSPIECFGPESSDFATAVLSGADVTLEFDETQGRYDRYGRVLAHVWVPTDAGGVVLFGAEVVAQGYGEERQYGDDPTTWTGVMRDLEGQARAAGAGLWGSC